MADVAIDSVASGRARDRLRILGWLRLQDNAFRLLTLAAAAAVLLILGGVIAALAIGSLPALKAFGFGFLTGETWNPVTEKFGALPAIYGTLATSAIAMIFAVPIGIGIAIFLTELCPRALRRPIGVAIELLAGIPSIIYGIWGLFVFAPFLQRTYSAGADRRIRQYSRAVFPVRRAALRHRHPDRRLYPRHHGAALHHLRFARRVRDGARGFAANPPTPAAARHGRWSASSSFPTRVSASSAASCWLLAARSGRPWR